MTAEVEPYGTELVPATNMAALEALDPKAQEVAVTRMLSEARGWLAHAVEATQPQAMADFKAVMSTIAEGTRQLGLAKDIQLDALEMVRRAERGLGVAIRDGQENGTVRKPGQHADATYFDRWDGAHRDAASTILPSPTDYAQPGALSGKSGSDGIYDLTDGVSDEQFETALGDAKGEGNLSRANVVRKAKGEPARSTSKRHELLHRSRRIDVNRVVGATVEQVANPCPAGLFAELDWTAVDHSKIGEWVESLTESISALRSLRTNLVKESTRV